MATRGFEIVSEYIGAGINLPERKTAKSAGYDIESAADVSVEPHRVTLVPTGLKAYMQEDEYLGLQLRSSFSIRNNISSVNGEGIIDADYYNNPENEGHFFIALINNGDEAVKIKKGTRIAQGIFKKYLTADEDAPGVGKVRRGGIGSTGER